ncbi:unnamed protein product [marine sediment metagenome]|uniref:Uncharacterized protein n=1 Tax=marine sediment metagenome TaxID=412755 RepID=X0U832_9ZZZZ
MRVTVMNLATGKERIYMGCEPEDAVMAAYAQAHGDWCTWLYSKYQKFARSGRFCVSCGDWTAFKRRVVL